MASTRPLALFRLRDRLEDLTGLTDELLARRLLAPAGLPAALHPQAVQVAAALELLRPELVTLNRVMGVELARLDQAARHSLTRAA